MADVSVNMGVSGIAQFKQGMKDAEAGVKTLDAALKANEKQFQKTGDAEATLAAKTTLLNQKLQQQKNIVKNAEQALKQMEANGVKTSSASYQNMQRRLIEAQSAMQDTEAEIGRLGTKEVEAAGKTDQLANSLGGLNKKVSLEQVSSAIRSITGGMEQAAQKAVEMGKAIYDTIMDSAKWGDDTATQAMVLNMDVEEYQKYKNVFDTIGELTVAEWQKTKLKVQKAINDPTAEQTDILALLGIRTHNGQMGKYGWVEGAAKDFEEVFWEIGETLRAKVASGELSQDLADVYANAIFGKGFAELNPLFKLGQEAFTQALKEQDVVTEESVQNLAELNDAVIKIEGQFNALKAEIIGQIAPAFKDVADVVGGLLHELNVYLKSEDGQKLLTEMGNAVSELFEGLKGISAEDIVNGFKTGFDAVVDGLKWVVDNKDVVIGALEGIIAGWGTLKLFGAAADMLKLVNGLQSLLGIGGGAATGAGAAGAAATGAATWVSGLISGIGQGAFNMALYDSAGALSLIPYMFMDKTAAGQALQHGEGIDGAIEAGKKEIELAATQAVQNWVDYGDQLKNATETIINSTLDFASSSTLTDTLNGGFVLHLDADELSKEWQGLFGGGNKENEPELPVKPELPADAQQQLQNAMDSWNPMKIYVTPIINEPQGNLVQGHANGLPWVPFDGYAAILHRGERVLTARENKSYTYNNNNYFGSVNLNNGLQVEALAESLARQNQRQRAGYGA